MLFCFPQAFKGTANFEKQQKLLKINLFAVTASPPMTCLGGTSLEGGGTAKVLGGAIVQLGSPTKFKVTTKSMIFGDLTSY